MALQLQWGVSVCFKVCIRLMGYITCYEYFTFSMCIVSKGSIDNFSSPLGRVEIHSHGFPLFLLGPLFFFRFNSQEKQYMQSICCVSVSCHYVNDSNVVQSSPMPFSSHGAKITTWVWQQVQGTNSIFSN